MITLVYPYYKNKSMLERHLTEWSSYAPHIKEQMRAIIVDDGSPVDPASDCIRPVGFPIELYKIRENLPWNVAGARNLGMKHAPDGWCLITDIDHLLKSFSAEFLMFFLSGFASASGKYYTMAREWADGRPLNPHPNSFILERSLFWKVGGYDEDWTGWWGAGEQVFRKTLSSKAKGDHILSVCLTHFGRDDIPDASTTDWGRRGSEYDWTKNPKLVEKAKRAPYKPENPLRFEWTRII